MNLSIAETVFYIISMLAVGFLFTIIFCKTKSLLACIGTHSVLNALSVFGNEGAMTAEKEIFSAAALAGISILYAFYILKLDGNRSEMEDETI